MAVRCPGGSRSRRPHRAIIRIPVHRQIHVGSPNELFAIRHHGGSKAFLSGGGGSGSGGGGFAGEADVRGVEDDVNGGSGIVVGHVEGADYVHVREIPADHGADDGDLLLRGLVTHRASIEQEP